jgi:hypothetical protein
MSDETKTVDLDNFDPETVSLEELRARIAQEPQSAEPTQNAEIVTQDAEEPEPATQEATGEPDEVVYERKIDLGDGAGVQIFRADSLEGLVDKLASAQENATRKIRELNRSVKSQQPQVAEYKPKEFSADEEFVLSQELMSKPSAAFKKIFQDTVGMPIETFRGKMEKLSVFEKSQSAQAASVEFVQAHPEYVANAANGKRIVKYLETYKLEANADNLERAYADLNSSGFLELKPADEGEPAKEQPRTAAGQFAAKAPVAPAAPKKSSGLSARSRAITPVKSGPSVADLYDMPMDKLRDLANQSTRNGGDF